MSHQQRSAAPPRWKRRFNITVCGLIILGAGVANVLTQYHLASRIPDWAGFAWVVPIASWLYSLQSTLNWATATTEAEARVHHRGVVVGLLLSELMNVGEHVWAYVGENGTLDWGAAPSVLTGSLPAIIDFLSILSAAKVLTGSQTTNVPALSDHVEDIPAIDVPVEDVPGAVPSNQDIPAPPVVPEVPAKLETSEPPTTPSPKDPTAPPAEEPLPLPTSLDARKARIERDILWLLSLDKRDIKWRAMSGEELVKLAREEFNEPRRVGRSWLDMKKKAVARQARIPVAAGQ